MRNTVFWLGLAIIATAIGALLLFSGDGSVLGIEPDRFASLSQLSVMLLIAAAVLAGFRGRLRPQLWHAAVWLAVLVALMVGWRIAHGGL